jgi:hypothetical protein
MSAVAGRNDVLSVKCIVQLMQLCAGSTSHRQVPYQADNLQNPSSVKRGSHAQVIAGLIVGYHDAGKLWFCSFALN